MTDTPAPPGPAELASMDAALGRAMTLGANEYLRLADAYAGAGVALPPAHRETVARLRGVATQAGIGNNAGIAHLSEREVMDTLDSMAARGASPPELAALAQSEGAPGWERDDRTPAQIAHDAAYGMERYVDPKSYGYVLPAGAPEIGDPKEAAAFDENLRSFAGDLGMDANTGSNFIRQILAVGDQLRTLPAEARAERVAEWCGQVERAFGERFAEASQDVKDYLALVENNSVAEAIVRDGAVLSHPMIFGLLASRAAAFKAWRDSRPK